MTRLLHLLPGCVLLVALVVGVADAQPTGDNPHVAAAKKREEVVRTVVVEFRVNEDVAEGAVSSAVPKGALRGKPRIVPEKATKLESTNKLVLSRSKSRFESNHPTWALETGEVHKLAMVNTGNGEYDKTFYPVGMNDPNQPEGFIGRNAQSSQVKSYLVVPVTLCFRGTDSAVTAYMLSDFRAVGALANVRGKECAEFAKAGGSGSTVRMWFDPAAEYMPRRVRVEREGKPRNQYEIDYRQHESGSWVPTSWVRTEFGTDGKVAKRTEAEVTSITLNEGHSDEEFDIRFPEKTRLYNGREQKMYIVQPSGQLREYDMATGELASETIPQPGTPWVQRNWVALAGGASALVLCVLFLVRWRARRHA